MKKIKNITYDYSPLFERMKELKISQNYLITKCGIHRDTFAKLRNGDNITMDRLLQLAIHLNTTDLNQLVRMIATY